MSKKTLGSIRVEENHIENMKGAIKKYNDDPKTLMPFTMKSFRRYCYEIVSQAILQDIPIPVKAKILQS